MASFAQDFSAPGAGTITDFNPSEDTLDLQGFGGNPDFSEISVTSTDGGTVIGFGGDSTLFVEGVTPDQFRPGNVTIDGGELKVGPSGRDLESIVKDLAEGNDLLSGGLKNDTFDGGAGDDTLQLPHPPRVLHPDPSFPDEAERCIKTRPGQRNGSQPGVPPVR